MVLFIRVPDEVLSLPPQPWLNWGTVVGSFHGWLSAVIDNGLNRRPILISGVHRQVLWASVGFGVGYYLMKRAQWKFALRDKELEEYMERHPEDFKRQEPRYIRDIFEKFHPIR